MKYLLVLCVILIASHYVGAFQDQIEEDCAQEFMRILSETQNCSSTRSYNILKVDATFARAANGEIAKYQLKRYLINVCRFKPNDTECFGNIKSNEACQNSANVKLALNMNTIIKTQIDYMCNSPEGSNATRYLEWVKKDGPYCVAANQPVKFCMKTATDQLGLNQVSDMLKVDMCVLLKIHVDCAYLYDYCKNKKVKEYMLDILDILNEKYNCSPDV